MGEGGWGPCLFLLPEMCVLQLLAFVQDMIWKEMKQQRLEPRHMKWASLGKDVRGQDRGSTTSKPFDVFLLFRPLSLLQVLLPFPPEPLGCGILAPASLTLPPSSIAQWSSAPRTPACGESGGWPVLQPRPAWHALPGPLLWGCTQRTCAGVLQSWACGPDLCPDFQPHLLPFSANTQMSQAEFTYVPLKSPALLMTAKTLRSLGGGGSGGSKEIKSQEPGVFRLPFSSKANQS